MGFVEKEMLMFAVLIFVTGGKQGVGGVSIRNCENNMIDIRESRVNAIYCEGFDSSPTIEWSIKRGTDPNEPVATCDASTCTMHESARFAASMLSGTSYLGYQQYDRDQDMSTSIVCASTSAGTTTVASCRLNVIAWAYLTNCFIAYSSSTQILEGSCEYDKAYSYSRSMKCTWFQDGQISFTGKVTRTYVSRKFTKGKCTFSLQGLKSWAPGTYIYTILFYPSRGEKIVSKGNIASSTTTTTTTTTISTTPVKSTTTKKPKMISLTTSFDGENDGSPIELQRGQKAFLLTCRYDNTSRSAGHVSWCRTGSTCGEQSGSEGSNTTSECPEGSRICSTMRNRTCAENIGQEVVTQSCEGYGSEPCGVTLTIKKVSECDGGTYSCYVFSSVNASKYEVASVTVFVEDCENSTYGPECLDTCGNCAGNQTCNTSTGYCLTCLAGWTPPLCATDCEHNTYGPECLDTCGRCAGNQTCNTTTGHCLTCLAGWTPPLCTTAVPEKPLLTPTEQIVVGITAGAPLTWGFIATLVQVVQILGNAGWMPFLSIGGKEEEKEGKGVDESSEEEAEPPSKCSRFLNFILCGGAGMCLLSILFCISCGKLLSNKFSWRKDAIQNDAESKQQQLSLPDDVITDQPVQKSKDSTVVVIYPTESSTDKEPISRGLLNTTPHEESQDSLDSPDESLDPPEVRKLSARVVDKAKFTDQYFAVASWLENPHKDRAQAKKKSHSSRATRLSGFYSSGFHNKKAKYQTGDQ